MAAAAEVARKVAAIVLMSFGAAAIARGCHLPHWATIFVAGVAGAHAARWCK